MVFPTQLTDYLQPSVDKFTFTIAEDLDDSETGIDITGGTAAFEVPCMINIGDEIMKVLSKTDTTLTVDTRGNYGTTATTHDEGDAGYIPFTSQHYNELVDQKDAVLMYLCRTESSLPGSGTEYEMLAYDKNGLLTVSVSAGGSGYEVNDTLTVSGGSTGGTLNVDSVSGGAVTGVSIVTRGAGYSTGTGVSTSGGSGSGCTVDIDTITISEVYIYNGVSWELIGNITFHDELKDLDSGDPHPAYYLEAEMEAAHDALDGGTTGHVIDGDSHDHLEGQGIGRLRTTSGVPITTPNDGEVALDTSTGILYTGYLSSWSAVVGAPSGLIMPFDPTNLSSSCPSGWSRYTDLDSKFVKGTSSSSSSSDGSATHSHDFDSTDVVTHYHHIDAQTVEDTASEPHTHDIYEYTYTDSYTGFYDFSSASSTGSLTSTSSGGHSHTGTMSNNTQNYGSSDPSTDSANGEPPYQKVVWCQKD